MLLRCNRRIRRLDTTSYIVPLPYLRFDRFADLTLSIAINTGGNPWHPWFAEVCVCILYWELAIGIRPHRR